MAFPDIVIGSAGQAVVGFDIVIGDAAVPAGAMLDFMVPSALTGIAMVAVIVRNDNPVICSDLTWTKVIDGAGASGLYIDAWQREIDGTAGALPGDVISFLSEEVQELQGGLVLVRRPLVATLVNAVEHHAFTSVRTLPAPAVDVADVNDSLLLVWSASGEVDFDPPDTQRAVDEYGSSEFTSRSILITTRRAGDSGEVTAESVRTDIDATGRVWAIAVRSVPLITNPSGHAARVHSSTVVNPSGHARKM